MARQNQTKEYNTFIKGIITEASSLVFPENASLDEENFVLNRTGSRQRRLGMDYENLYTKVDTSLNSVSIESFAISSHLWDNVDSSPDVALSVIQIGNKLYFADAYEDSYSGNLKNGGVPLVLSTIGAVKYQTSVINGVLVVVTGESVPFYLSYDINNDTISKTDINIKVRDLWGVDDGLAVDTRPTVLTNPHKYNLLNQGWPSDKINTIAYPSNADIVSHGKKVDGTGWTSAIFLQNYFGTTPAPRGKYIIDAFARGTSRTTESGVPVIADTDNTYVSAICTHAGRLFYAGMSSNTASGDSRSPDYTGMIFFTKTIDGLDDLHKCYQDADPSSEHIYDLIDTDGGYVTIPESGKIYKLISYGNSVVVFAANGIWRVFSTEKGFTATDQEIERITTVGAISADSVVIAEDVIYYWARGGIYAIQPEEITGSLISNNISQNTIQTLFINIGSTARAFATGNYDPVSKKVSWLYNTDSDYTGSTFKQKYNRELIFDVVLGAFYKNKIESLAVESPYIAAYTQTKDFLNLNDTQVVVVDGVHVQADADNVTVTDNNPISNNPTTTKYLVLVPESTYKFTFSYYKDTDFMDWQTEDSVGVTYLSYLNTGYELYGDSMRTKQVPYIFFHFERTEDGYQISGNGVDYTNPSSCMVQAQWGWSDSANSGRWGTPFQAYRLNRHYIPSGSGDTFDYGFDVITTKSKLRGKGKALSLYIYSEAGKDLRLHGWAISAAGVTVP